MVNHQLSPVFTPTTGYYPSLSPDDRIKKFTQLVSGMIQSLPQAELPEGVEPEDLRRALEAYRDRKVQQMQEQFNQLPSQR